MVMKVEGQFPVGASPVQRTGRPREFGKKQQNPVRRFGGIAVVLLLHVVLIYALLNGLATKVVQVIQHPIETRIIEPVKPPPPPECAGPRNTALMKSRFRPSMYAR